MTLRSSLIAGAVLLSAVTGPAARTQDPQAVLLQKQFADVSGWVAKAADMVPADTYGYRPVATVRTLGEQVAHIADSYTYFCAQAAGRPLEWSDAIEKGPADKATVLQKLATATDGCAKVYGGASAGAAAPLLANNAHTHLHYGNLVTYVRMLGLVPPSS